MNNNKAKMLGLVLMMGMLSTAQAEVLVILPESGPMARAASSIQQGFLHTYQAGKQKTPIRFVDSHQFSMSFILQNEVNEQTQMLIGPLSRQQVEELIQLQPQVKTIALNHIEQTHSNVTQFSLAKREDAQALMQVIQKDGIQELMIVRKEGTEKEYELFLSALLDMLKIKHELVDQIPLELTEQQGVLFLGDAVWMRQLGTLPTQHIYATANAVEEIQNLPTGLKFCDTSAQYGQAWKSMQSILVGQSMAFQRLVAFGSDVAQLALFYLNQPTAKQYEFNGHSGKISVNGNHIQRLPTCFQFVNNKVNTL
jgi:uncharacterized protein